MKAIIVTSGTLTGGVYALERRFDYLELANSQVESARHGERNLISSDAVEQERVDGISEDEKRRMREIAKARTVPPLEKTEQSP